MTMMHVYCSSSLKPDCRLQIAESFVRGWFVWILAVVHAAVDCGQRETREHLLLSCSLYRSQRIKMRSSLAALDLGYTDISSLLSVPEALPSVLRFVNDTGRFPRYHALLAEEGAEERERGKGQGKAQGKAQGPRKARG